MENLPKKAPFRRRNRHGIIIGVQACSIGRALGWHEVCRGGLPAYRSAAPIMFHPLMTCLLLSAAAGLSMRRFLLPYLPGGDAAEKRAPVTMVASAVFLAAIAFTVSDQKLWALPIVLTFSLWLASLFDDVKPNKTIAVSVVSLATYLGLRSIQ